MSRHFLYLPMPTYADLCRPVPTYSYLFLLLSKSAGAVIVLVRKLQSNSGNFKEIGKKLPKTLVTLPTVVFADVFADVFANAFTDAFTDAFNEME